MVFEHGHTNRNGCHKAHNGWYLADFCRNLDSLFNYIASTLQLHCIHIVTIVIVNDITG